MSELTVRGLEKGFAAVPVLRGLDLTVRQGSLAAVLGPSGCGKTTLLRLVAGFERPDAGTIALDGEVVSSAERFVPPERRRVGVVPQEGALFPHLSVGGNVGFGLSRAARRSGRVTEMLELVGLGGYADRMPGELSGGQQQRVALARALAPDPALVLLDEPFSALDTTLRQSLREDVRAALRAAGATAVLVTHDQQEALSMADVVAVVRSGVVVQSAAPSALYTAPGDVGVATFVGEAVVLPAVVRDGIATTVLGPLALREEWPDGPGQVVVRPEQVKLGEPAHGAPARVRGTTFYGHDALVQLELLGSLSPRSLSPRSLSPGFLSREESHGTVSGPVVVSARSHGHDVVADDAVVGLRVSGPVSFFPLDVPSGTPGAVGSAS